MTEKLFIMQMALLYKYLGVEPDGEKTSLYWKLLKHMTDDDFKTALTGVMREFVPTTANPFPLVSQFLEFSSLNAHGIATKAISTLKAYYRRVGRYESVSFGDVTLHAVVERFGGWPAICAFGDNDWNVNEGRMIETYKTMYQSGSVPDCDHLQGLSEKDAGFYRVYHIDSKNSKMIQYQRYQGSNLIETVNLQKPVIENKRYGLSIYKNEEG